MDLSDALTRVRPLLFAAPLLVALLAALALPPAGAAAPAPVYDADGNLVQTPFAPPEPEPRLDEERATAIFLRHPKVADWLARYPPRSDHGRRSHDDGFWTVKAWSGPAGQIALGKVDDASGVVTEAWTGPQVAWKMARGYDGAFGGRTINSRWVWLAFSAAFLLGLGNLRRPLSLRNLDLLALLAFTPSLYAFNRGEVFWSVPLAIPPLALRDRPARVDRRARASRRPHAADAGPPGCSSAATVFLLGFRIGLNVQAPYSVIDVGYAGVIGAHRIANGQSPYGNFPRAGRPAGVRPRRRRGRDPQPHPDERPLRVVERARRHVRAGLVPRLRPRVRALRVERQVGRRHVAGRAFHRRSRGISSSSPGSSSSAGASAGRWLAAALAFAWAAYPVHASTRRTRTRTTRSRPAFLVWGFWLATSPWARGAAVALSGWTKFSTLIVAPLWLTYPSPPRARPLAFVGGVRCSPRAAAFVVLLLEPDLVEAARTFADRTFLLAARPRVAVLALGLGAVPRRGHPGPEARPARAAGAARRGGDRRRVRAAAEVAAPARRAHRAR